MKQSESKPKKVKREDSLSNLSAIISSEKDTKKKRLHELVKKRIESLRDKK